MAQIYGMGGDISSDGAIHSVIRGQRRHKTVDLVLRFPGVAASPKLFCLYLEPEFPDILADRT